MARPKRRRRQCAWPAREIYYSLSIRHCAAVLFLGPQTNESGTSLLAPRPSRFVRLEFIAIRAQSHSNSCLARPQTVSVAGSASSSTATVSQPGSADSQVHRRAGSAAPDLGPPLRRICRLPESPRRSINKRISRCQHNPFASWRLAIR